MGTKGKSNLHSFQPFRLVAVLVLLLVAAQGCGKFKTGRQRAEEARLAALREASEARRQKALDKARAEAQQRFQKAMANVPPFDRKEAARQLLLEKLKVDIDKVTLRSMPEVEELLRQRANDAADQSYPLKARERLLRETEKDFSLFQPGDKVTIHTNTNRTVEGTIDWMDRKAVKVDKYVVRLEDIVQPDARRFNEERWRTYRDYLMRINFDVPRRDLVEAKLKELREGVLRESGCVPYNGSWRRLDDLLKTVYAEALARQEAAYKAAAEKRIRAEVEAELQAEGILPLPEVRGAGTPP